MNCQTQFSEKKTTKKHTSCIIKLLSFEFDRCVVKVKLETIFNLILIWCKGYTNPLMSITAEAS